MYIIFRIKNKNFFLYLIDDDVSGRECGREFGNHERDFHLVQSERTWWCRRLLLMTSSFLLFKFAMSNLLSANHLDALTMVEEDRLLMISVPEKQIQ